MIYFILIQLVKTIYLLNKQEENKLCTKGAKTALAMLLSKIFDGDTE